MKTNTRSTGLVSDEHTSVLVSKTSPATIGAFATPKPKQYVSTLSPFSKNSKIAPKTADSLRTTYTSSGPQTSHTKISSSLVTSVKTSPVSPKASLPTSNTHSSNTLSSKIHQLATTLGTSVRVSHKGSETSSVSHHGSFPIPTISVRSDLSRTSKIIPTAESEYKPSSIHTTVPIKASQTSDRPFETSLRTSTHSLTIDIPKLPTRLTELTLIPTLVHESLLTISLIPTKAATTDFLPSAPHTGVLPTSTGSIEAKSSPDRVTGSTKITSGLKLSSSIATSPLGSSHLISATSVAHPGLLSSTPSKDLSRISSTVTPAHKLSSTSRHSH